MHANVPTRRTRRLGRARERRPIYVPPGAPPSTAGEKRVFLTCHYCGYGPDVVPADGMCPKCGGHSWERYAVLRRYLPDEQ
jgi:rubrerythrin